LLPAFALLFCKEGRSPNTGGSAFTGPALPACLDHIEYLDRRTHLVGIQIVWIGTRRSVGGAAGILRFVPYLGTMIILSASGIAGLLQFGSLPPALAIAATTVFISGSVGMLFGTWLQGRFARVNEAVLFIALLFFGWLWGVAGLLLGAPLLAVIKVVCDRLESLKPVGEMLGR